MVLLDEDDLPSVAAQCEEIAVITPVEKGLSRLFLYFTLEEGD
jgi:hypothetical protein